MGVGEAPLLLDRFLPVYQFSEEHSIRIRASPARIVRAIKEVTPAEIPFWRTLFWIRALPARLVGRSGYHFQVKPLWEQATVGSFVLLAEDPERELVVGTVGQFWRPQGAGTVYLDGPQAFLDFDRPGYAKAALNFLIEPEERDCRLGTETRITVAEAAARRRFAGYWRVIYPGSALLRRIWLRAIKRRAERAS